MLENIFFVAFLQLTKVRCRINRGGTLLFIEHLAHLTHLLDNRCSLISHRQCRKKKKTRTFVTPENDSIGKCIRIMKIILDKKYQYKDPKQDLKYKDLS